MLPFPGKSVHNKPRSPERGRSQFKKSLASFRKSHSVEKPYIITSRDAVDLCRLPKLLHQIICALKSPVSSIVLFGTIGSIQVQSSIPILMECLEQAGTNHRVLRETLYCLLLVLKTRHHCLCVKMHEFPIFYQKLFYGLHQR